MKKRNLVYLIGIVLFGLLLRLIFFSGVDPSDDLFYAQYANDLSKGTYSAPDVHQGTRLGLLYPVSFFYTLFGVNDFSSTIFILLSSIGEVILIFYFGKEFFNEEIGLMAAFLLSFFPLEVVFATKLLPDVPAAFFVSLGVFFFLKGEKEKSSTRRNISYIISGFSLGFAYLIKELSVLIAFFFVIYILFYKKIRLCHILLGIGPVILFIIEGYFFWVNTGNFFFQFQSFDSYYAYMINERGSFGRDAFPMLLFHYPYLMFTNFNFGLFYSFIPIAFLYFIYFKKRDAYPFLIWGISVLAYLSFGSATLTRYIPIPGASRYLTIVTVPTILILALFLKDSNIAIKKVIMPSVLAILLVTSIGLVYFNLSRSDNGLSVENFRSISPYIKNSDKKVYTDFRSEELINYRLGYEKALNLKRFNFYCDLWRKSCKEKDIFVMELDKIKGSYVLINHKLVNGVSEIRPIVKFPKDIDNPPKNWIIVKKLGEDSDSTILYYAP